MANLGYALAAVSTAFRVVTYVFLEVVRLVFGAWRSIGLTYIMSDTSFNGEIRARLFVCNIPYIVR